MELKDTDLLQESGLKQSLDAYIAKLEEEHRLHRKIKFLLDVRGLLVINKLKGDYVEFGVYRGEMMYAASKVFSPQLHRYIGLDTFSGLPTPDKEDERLFVFEKEGFMASPKKTAQGLLEGVGAVLIEGDFRKSEVQNHFKPLNPDISVLSIDCNWKSSVEAALYLSGPFLKSGSVVYIDDFFVATRHPNFNSPILEKVSREHHLKFVEFMTYPPCGRAFIIEKS